MLLPVPTAAVDPGTLNEVLDVMVERSLEDMTVFVGTDAIGFARNVTDRVIFMDEGNSVEDARKGELFDMPRSDRAQLFLSKILYH